MTSSCQMRSKHGAARGQDEEARLLYSACLAPSVNHSSRAVLLFNGHSRSAGYSSRENDHTKGFNPPTEPEAISLSALLYFNLSWLAVFPSWPLFTSQRREMLIFLRGLMDRATSLRPVAFALSVTVAASRAQTGFQLWDFTLTFLSVASPNQWSRNKHSVSCFLPLVPRGWKGAEFPQGVYWDTQPDRCYGPETYCKTLGCMRATSHTKWPQECLLEAASSS